jgi:hypothetical protein
MNCNVSQFRIDSRTNENSREEKSEVDYDIFGSNLKQGNDVYHKIPYWPEYV